LRNNCKYYFSIDSTSHLDNPDTLKVLIEQNRGIISPVMIRPDSTWSNVWGAISEKGFYERSDDYLDIINRNKM
jgi:procollagen-lysine,2-oxoglutarate 5-dioxygenase